MKCPRCPLSAEDRECPGQKNDRVCYRADKTSPHHTPGIIAKILGFTVAASQHVAAGMPQASPEVQAARLAICQACERFEPDNNRCQACGCGLSLKANWADQSCPTGKWLAVEGETPR